MAFSFPPTEDDEEEQAAEKETPVTSEEKNAKPTNSKAKQLSKVTAQGKPTEAKQKSKAANNSKTEVTGPQNKATVKSKQMKDVGPKKKKLARMNGKDSKEDGKTKEKHNIPKAYGETAKKSLTAKKDGGLLKKTNKNKKKRMKLLQKRGRLGKNKFIALKKMLKKEETGQ